MRITEYLRADFVLAHLRGRDMAEVVQEVAGLAATAGIGPEIVIAEKLLERERAHSTVMGKGLAVPHATVPGIASPVIGVACSDDPIAFGPS